MIEQSQDYCRWTEEEKVLISTALGDTGYIPGEKEYLMEGLEVLCCYFKASVEDLAYHVASHRPFKCVLYSWFYENGTDKAKIAEMQAYKNALDNKLDALLGNPSYLRS